MWHLEPSVKLGTYNRIIERDDSVDYNIFMLYKTPRPMHDVIQLY